jgi:hypothetical protein
MQIKTTDNTRPTPFATLLFVLGTAASLAAASPALADAKGGL